MEKIRLEQVFGVSRHQILSYLSRDRVDGLFNSALKSDKQIIVYGSSKQGKTALVDKHVPYNDNLNISCSPDSSVLDIYQAILRKLNIEIISKTQKESTKDFSATLEGRVTAKIPFLGSSEAQAIANQGNGQKETSEYEKIELNLNLANDVAELIKKTKTSKFIILENFHYLTDEIQKKLAFDLRTFQELGVRFIILGVWREKNRLTQFNGDLLDRIIEIPVEPWQAVEFREVVRIGEGLLNIKLSEEIIAEIINSAFDSIGVVQELLKAVCQGASIIGRQNSYTNIDDFNLLTKAKEDKANDYAARHIRALENIAEGRKASNPKEGLLPLYLPFYTVKAILAFDFEIILQGIKRDQLEISIKRNHHRSDDVRPGDMSNLLYNFAKLQSEKGIVPPIFDYDQSTRTLRIVDSTFYFFLKNIDKSQILGNIISPVTKRASL